MNSNSGKGNTYFNHSSVASEIEGGFSLAADAAAGTGRAPNRKVAPPSTSNARKERPSTPPRQSLTTRDRPSTPPRQSFIRRERASTPPRQSIALERSSTPPRQSIIARKERSLSPPKRQSSGMLLRSSTPPPRLSASQPQSITTSLTTALAPASRPPFDKRFSVRENAALDQHSVRICRSSSAGSLRKVSNTSGSLSKRGKTPPKVRAQRESIDRGLSLSERHAASSSSSSVVALAEARILSSPSHSGSTSTSLGSPIKAVDSKDMYQQVSSLVEELEAARSLAEVSGSRPPKALEAAASALEPLLRLRDVTGAFACDLSSMPWLPQLLGVFRNVLHTAVDGPRAPPRSPQNSHLTSADLGAGGFAGAAVQGIDGDNEFIGLASLAQASVLLELDALRTYKSQQDQALRDSQQREKELQEDVALLEARQKELLRQVDNAEGRAAAALQAARKAEAVARDAALNVVAADSSLPSDHLARRVAGLERETCRWESEKLYVEERLAELTSLVTAAVEKDIETRPNNLARSSQNQLPPSSPSRASAASIKQRYVDQMARVVASSND